jgi:hypothetical protein
MPTHITSGHLEKWKAKYDGALSKVAKHKEKLSEMADTGISAAATTGTAFALGMVDGQTGGVDIKGVPLPAIVGVVAHGAAFFTGKHALHDIGNGGLAAWAYSVGRSVGIEHKSKSKVKGDDKGQAKLTAEELAAIAA